MFVDSTKTNVRPKPGQSNFSKIPFDYGKNIVNPEIQNHFLDFLKQEDVQYDKSLDSIWYGEAALVNDIFERVRILQAGSEKGSVLCDQEIGCMLMSGNEVFQRDIALSRIYLEKAAKCGLPTAMFFLGVIYVHYDDMVFEALDWLCKAAIKGCVPSYKTLNNFSRRYKLKIEIEDRLSVYFREICDQKEPDAIENRFLGFCYYVGLCCIQNTESAMSYWKDAKEQGDISAGILLRNSNMIGFPGLRVIPFKYKFIKKSVLQEIRELR